MSERTIVFFDGVCGLCNGFVDFLFRIDSKGNVAVAALQGRTAEKFLPPPLRVDLETIVVRTEEGKILTKSDAVLHALSKVGGVWRLLSTLAALVPTSLRNVVYGVVARRRYDVFGKRGTCRMPSKEERSRFLD